MLPKLTGIGTPGGRRRRVAGKSEKADDISRFEDRPRGQSIRPGP